MSRVSKEALDIAARRGLLERMRTAISFDPDAAHISIRREALEELIKAAEGVVALEAWAETRLAEVGPLAKEPPNELLKDLNALDVEQANALATHELARVDAILEMRIMNFTLRILRGETPEFGCEACTPASECFYGSVACVRKGGVTKQ